MAEKEFFLSFCIFLSFLLLFLPRPTKKSSILGRCLSQDATWLAKSYSRPQLAFFTSFFYSPFSLSLVFTPSLARSRSISRSLPPAFSNLLPLSLVWYLSVQPLPSASTSFSPPSFLGCVFSVATHVSLGRFSSLTRAGQALSSWLGNTLQDVLKERITEFSTLTIFVWLTDLCSYHLFYSAHFKCHNGKKLHEERTLEEIAKQFKPISFILWPLQHNW